MYWISKKVAFEKFDMVFGGNLNRRNRRVVFADLITWDEAEKRNASLFVSNNGRSALSMWIM